jgi:hypothetical protein
VRDAREIAFQPGDLFAAERAIVPILKLSTLFKPMKCTPP